MFRLSPGTNDIIDQPFFDDCPAVVRDPPKFPSTGDFNRLPTSADAFYLQVRRSRDKLFSSMRLPDQLRLIHILFSKPWSDGYSRFSLGR